MIFFGTFNNRAMNVQFFFQSLEALKKKKKRMLLFWNASWPEQSCTIIIGHCFQALGVLKTFFFLHTERRE